MRLEFLQLTLHTDTSASRAANPAETESPRRSAIYVDSHKNLESALILSFSFLGFSVACTGTNLGGCTVFPLASIVHFSPCPHSHQIQNLIRSLDPNTEDEWTWFLDQRTTLARRSAALKQPSLKKGGPQLWWHYITRNILPVCLCVAI